MGQALSDSVKFSRRLMQEIWTFCVVIQLPLNIRATEQNIHDRNKIANEI